MMTFVCLLVCLFVLFILFYFYFYLFFFFFFERSKNKNCLLAVLLAKIAMYFRLASMVGVRYVEKFTAFLFTFLKFNKTRFSTVFSVSSFQKKKMQFPKANYKNKYLTRPTFQLNISEVLNTSLP